MHITRNYSDFKATFVSKYFISGDEQIVIHERSGFCQVSIVASFARSLPLEAEKVHSGRSQRIIVTYAIWIAKLPLRTGIFSFQVAAESLRLVHTDGLNSTKLRSLTGKRFKFGSIFNKGEWLTGWRPRLLRFQLRRRLRKPFC